MKHVNLGTIITNSIKKNRIKKGLSVYRLAQLVECTPSHLHRIENGKGQPSLQIAKKICEVLEVKPHLMFEFNAEILSTNLKQYNIS